MIEIRLERDYWSLSDLHDEIAGEDRLTHLTQVEKQKIVHLSDVANTTNSFTCLTRVKSINL